MATVPRARVTPERAAFRDQSGRLDFEKICSMLEGKDHTEGCPLELASRIDGWWTPSVEDTNTPKANPVTSTVQGLRPDRSEHPDVDGAVPSNEAPPPLDCDELQQLVAERLGKGKELKGSERKTTQKVVQDGDDGIAVEVARLSEEETRRALTARGSILVFASMTNVRPPLLLSDDHDSAPLKCTRGNLNRRDIRRAPDFMERVDEIIWRRSSLPTNSSLDPMFSAGNVEGLLSLLELREKMVRSPSP
ncbi:hypothetical protein EDD15DRAFT_2529435 [Pisolithus albus]|nr:hypothetical protein EDD15DRAFT_2529435 [Pisolithus albus]